MPSAGRCSPRRNAADRNSSWPITGGRCPIFRKVRDLLEEGRIGTPQQVEVRYLRPAGPEDRDPARLPWRLRREVGGDGYFYDMAPHTLDILDFLLGEISGGPRGEEQPRRAVRGGRYGLGRTPVPLVASSGKGLWSFVAPPEETEDSVLIVGSRARSASAPSPLRPSNCRLPKVRSASPSNLRNIFRAR